MDDVFSIQDPHFWALSRCSIFHSQYPVQVSRDFETGDVFPPSLLSVFETFPPVHTKMLKQWEYDSRTGAVWRMAPSYSKTSVFVRPHEEIKVAF